jgi:lambda family phage minor tail protein L
MPRAKPKLQAHAQQPTISPNVELFDLDVTTLGGGMLHWTAGPLVTVAGAPVPQPVTWRGIIYQPLPCKTDGFDVPSGGTLPRPTITVANVNLQIGGQLITYNDLRGAILTRHRTHAMFLDGAPQADPDVEWGPDVFRVERKAGQEQIFVTMELAAPCDMQGQKLPARPMLQDACVARYRYWDATAQTFRFNQTDMACPFNGSSNANKMFDANGNQVFDPALDKPSRRLATCCKLRFPNQPLPTFAFPGLQVL